MKYIKKNNLNFKHKVELIKPRFEQLNNNCVIASTKNFISFKGGEEQIYI